MEADPTHLWWSSDAKQYHFINSKNPPICGSRAQGGHNFGYFDDVFSNFEKSPSEMLSNVSDKNALNDL